MTRPDSPSVSVATVEPVVFVVDDDEAARDSLCWLIGSVRLKVAAFASAADFLAAYRVGQPGCLVTDVRMPGLSGLDLQAELKRREIDLPVIVVTGHGDVPMAVRAMKAGAFDFIEKPFNDQALLDLVHKAVERSVAACRDRAQRSGLQARLDQLTPRERQVLDMVVAGESNKGIAHRLGISEKTVEVHRAHVMAKMQARSLPELTRLVMRLDIEPG
jgi:RNA polymerase sigma factor (sigma-70 family)